MSICKIYFDKSKCVYFMIKRLICFYILVTLIDSIYIKYGNYYPIVLLEKFIHTIFWRNIWNFGFWGFGSSSWNIRSLRLECFISQNIRKFLRKGFFHFSSSKSDLLIFLFLRLQNPISRNIRNTYFRKYKKVPFPKI